MIEGKKVLAIIPARRDSKGLPGKNYKEICGKPLIEWSILAGLQSKYIDTIAVSSNCPHVEEITKKFDDPRVLFIKRPEILATDDSKTEASMVHAVDHLDKVFDIVCLLQPTSPARQCNLVDRCLMRMLLEGKDSVIAVTEKTPLFWRISPMYGKAEPCYTNAKRPMRQDLTVFDYYYHDCGNFYAIESDLLKTEGRTGRNVALYETPAFDSMQIDTYHDFLAMEALSKVYGSFLTEGA